MRRIPWRRVTRLAWLLAVAVAVALAVRERWAEVAGSIAQLSVGAIAFATLAALAGVGLSCGIWRALLAGLGSSLPLRAALRVFFVGQLGKYLPGPVWPALAQMELGRGLAVPRRASAAAVVLFLWVHLWSGVVLATLLLPATGLVPAWWALGAIPAAAVLLPGLLGRAVAAVLRLARREPLARLPDAGAVLQALAWALAMWACYGLHLWAVVGAVSVPVAIGVFAAAWAGGFLVLFAPAGAGAREAILVLLLPMLPAGAALGAALVSRLLLTLADVAWGLVGVAVRSSVQAHPGDRPR